MNKQANHMYTLQEAAEGYANAANRLFGNDNFLDTRPEVVPIFVSHLFQSLEISIKAAGIESGLFTLLEARQAGKGHGIQELADLATNRLGGKTSDLVMAMTCLSTGETRTKTIISEMIEGARFAPTRHKYLSRGLVYGEVSTGDIQILSPVQEWIEAVMLTAQQIPDTVSILKQWINSPSASEHFAIWFNTM